MEKLADRVQQILNRQKVLYTSLQSVFDQEKNQVLKVDIESLWETVEQKKRLLEKLENLNIEMKALIASRAAELGEDENKFSLSDLILKMPVSQKIKANLKNVKQDMELCKEQIYTSALANKHYVQESLGVINDIFAQAVQTAEKKNYSRSGNIPDQKMPTRLISTEV